MARQPPSPLRFVPIEALPAAIVSQLPPTLGTVPAPIYYYKALLVRLLTGTIDIECNKTNITVTQRNNYSTLVYSPNPKAYKKSLQSGISCSFAAYDQHIRTTVRSNYSLYKDIYFEFCGYFFLKELENHVGAFVHLYRILERVAYCLPLIWAGTAQDYAKTFAALKKYFENPKEGELKVLRRFVTDFIDVTERQTHATFTIASVHPDWQARYYETLFDMVKSSTGFVSSRQSDEIIVQFDGVLDLMITCRNMYFHALTGQAQHFNSDQIVDCNEFFYILNENFANWLAFLLFQVFENELARS